MHTWRLSIIQSVHILENFFPRINVEMMSYGSVKFIVLITHFCINAALYFLKIVFNILQSAFS